MNIKYIVKRLLNRFGLEILPSKNFPVEKLITSLEVITKIHIDRINKIVLINDEISDLWNIFNRGPSRNTYEVIEEYIQMITEEHIQIVYNNYTKEIYGLQKIALVNLESWKLFQSATHITYAILHEQLTAKITLLVSEVLSNQKEIEENKEELLQTYGIPIKTIEE